MDARTEYRRLIPTAFPPRRRLRRGVQVILNGGSMNKLKKFIAGVTAGDYVTLAAAVILIAATILYGVTGAKPAFGVTVSSGVVIAAVISVVLAALAVALRREILYYASYLLSFHVFLQFIVTQLRYISNVLVAIDGTTFSPSFIATAALMAVAWIASLVAAILCSVLCRKNSDSVEIVAEEGQS